MAVHVYRVVVRGEFRDLTSEQREALLAVADEHDYLKAAFTSSGTFTYDRRLVAFNLRYEIRVDSDSDSDSGDSDSDSDSGDGSSTDPVALGLSYAESDLTGWGLAWKRLRSSAVDMADYWTG